MIELIINKENQDKKICLVENGKLLELYEENLEDVEQRNEGNIYVGIVRNIIPGMQSAFVDIGTEKNSFIHAKDIDKKIDETKEKIETEDIKKLIKLNDTILVQVKKDSNNKKGARISTHINLTGKYVVLMPNTDIITVSQKIEDEEEKNRLKEIAQKNIKANTGVIIRTAASGKSAEEIVLDIKRLEEKWQRILNKFENVTKAPMLLEKAPSIIEKMLLDMENDPISQITVNNEEDYKEIQPIIDSKKIKLQIKKENLLKMYDLESQIEKVSQRKIWLNCGGFIAIDKTEALTAIDVNSRKFTGKDDFEETVYKVNYEATIEIAKQLRLRDIGGIIIIDYIDMKNPENKEKIENLLKQCLKQDRAKTQVEGFTKLNLMEMTRKHICSHND